MEERRFAALNSARSLPEAILDAQHAHGREAVAFQDISGDSLTRGRLALAGAVLERAFRRRLAAGERLGALLPAAPGVVAVLLGLWRAGRAPALINPTVGAASVLSALATAGCRQVLTSRAFVEKGKFEDLVTAIGGAGLSLIWTEDLKSGATLLDKGIAMISARRAPKDIGRATEAAILFTSGTEGAPKGVVLTHGNLLANAAQLRARTDIGPHDVAVSALPVFHSFGLTAGIVLPLVTGIRTGLHPSPLQYKIIPELVARMRATLLFGTDTFLAGWGRRGTREQLGTLRAAVAGAEPIKDATRRQWDAFGVIILEGYGATETGPVLALNTPDDQNHGTVGRFLTGVEHRLEPVSGIDGHRLLVRGPNVMAGYLRAGDPGRIEAPPEGWYDTGDIVRIGPKGHVTIVGRAKRFAKVGGEMVSLAAIEALASEVWPGEPLGAAALPDARKGERVVLAIAHPGASLDDLRHLARERGVPEIMLPSEMRILPEIPVMASGKTDFPRLQALLTKA